MDGAVTVVRGRLSSAGEGPEEGETHHELVAASAFRVEHIRSGRVATPVEFVQADDEWVIVLDGAASLEIGDERIEMSAGDWVLVPARQPHRLLRVEPGTRWLAVHGPPEGGRTGAGRH